MGIRGGSIFDTGQLSVTFGYPNRPRARGLPQRGSLNVGMMTGLSRQNSQLRNFAPILDGHLLCRCPELQLVDLKKLALQGKKNPAGPDARQANLGDTWPWHTPNHLEVMNRVMTKGIDTRRISKRLERSELRLCILASLLVKEISGEG